MATSATFGAMLRLRTGEVDLGRQRLVTPGGVVSLTTRETELLAYLSERAGQPVARDDLLTDVWHYRASNPTRAVDLAVKRLRAKVEPDPAEPVHILSVHGVGYRFVPLDEDEASPGPVDEQGALPTNLTPERTSFVGRAAELGRLGELLDEGARLVTITGPAGTGKTRLVRRFGTDRVDAFPGGVWFCDLAPTGTEEGAGRSRLEAILGAVVSTLGLPTASGARPDDVGRALADRAREQGQLLVILDNFEHVVEHAAKTVGQWLDFSADVTLLVTSRERLHVRGERILELQPLPWDDALTLLLERATALRRGLELSQADREILAGVVAQLDGIPLAIELAASRLGTLSPAQLQKRLASRFRLLGDPRSDRPRRHATLEAALDWSWELMSGDERRALAALSVFEGGFSLEAAEEVLDQTDDPDAPWPADLVQSLRDKSLLAMDDLAGGDLRYRLLESIRAYAASRLGQRGDEQRVRRLHADYYLREAEELSARLHTAAGVDRMEDLAREKANLVAVARHAPDPDLRIRAMLCLFPVLQARGPLGLLEELLDTSIELARQLEDLDVRLLGRLLVDRGIHQFGRGDMARAQADFEEAGRVASHHLDVRARALMGLGRVRQSQGRLEEAASCMRESIELFSRLGDRSGEGRARTLFATVLTWQDCVDEAQAEYERALRVLRRVSDRWTEGILYANLSGFLLERRHDAEQAENRAVQALKMLSEIGDHRASILLLTGFGVALVRIGRPADAIVKLERAVEVARRMGDRAREGQALASLGWALFELERHEEAEQQILRALTLLRDLGDRPRMAVALRLLGCVRQEQDRLLEAEQAIAESLEVLSDRDARVEHAVSALQLAFLRVEQGRPDEALALFDEAREQASSQLPWVELQSLAVTSVVRAGQAEVDVAGELLRQLEARVDPRDPREVSLIEPVAVAIELARARVRDRDQLAAATARAEALLQGGPGERGAAERRLVLRMLQRELDRTR